MPVETLRMLSGVVLAASVGVIALIITGERDPAILSFLLVLFGYGAYELWRWQTPGQ